MKKQIHDQLQAGTLMILIFQKRKFIKRKKPLLKFPRKLFHKYFTFGHNESGSLNLQGYLVKSFLFASIYYLMNVIMTKLSNI